MAKKGKRKGKRRICVDQAHLRDVARKTLRLIETHTIPVEGGRKVPDLGAKVAIGNALREHIDVFARALLALVTEDASIPASTKVLEGKRVGEGEGEIPPSLYSAVNQAIAVGHSYEMGSVIPDATIQSLRSVVAILMDLAPPPSPGAADSPERLRDLTPGEVQAYLQWSNHQNRHGLGSDKEIYRQLHDDEQIDRTFDAWRRQLSSARRKLGEQKNSPVGGRSATRSVIDAADLDEADLRQIKGDLDG